MTLQAIKITFLTLGMVALAVWLIRLALAEKIKNDCRVEPLIKVIERKKILTKVELVAVSFEEQNILLSISGEGVTLLAKSHSFQVDRMIDSQSSALKEC